MYILSISVPAVTNYEKKMCSFSTNCSFVAPRRKCEYQGTAKLMSGRLVQALLHDYRNHVFFVSQSTLLVCHHRFTLNNDNLCFLQKNIYTI